MINKVKCGSIPHLAHIETTYRCNQNCLFCYNPRRAEKINFEKLDKIVSAVAKDHIPHVYLSGGEPSLLGVERLNRYINLLSKNSSVTILTNGLITLKDLSKNLACFGIPIHGKNAREHEEMTKVSGSFEKAINSIKYYQKEGFDVRCIIVLTGYNYNKIYDLIKIASELKMESVYINRYEDGGIGAKNSDLSRLKPTLKQFRIALGQIINAKKDFKIFDGKIGFGTAIPFCLDRRLITEKMGATCGVGESFCAINSEGEFRICNQSEISFGNVLKEDIPKIWKKRKIDCFRCLGWVTEPCKSCSALSECLGGCKVDVNCCNTFCIDYAIRKDKDKIVKENIKYINKYFKKLHKDSEVELKKRIKDDSQEIKANKYLKINEDHKEKLIVTQYQTVVTDKKIVDLLNLIKKKQKVMIKKISNLMPFDEKELYRILNILLHIGAIDLIKNEKKN